jgi:hypothetical protein
MPILIHRPKLGELASCAIKPHHLGIYIGGPRGADDFHHEIEESLEAIAPDDQTLHVVSPYWSGLRRSDRISIRQQQEWNRQHQKAIFQLGAHGVAMFYAADNVPDAPLPFRPKKGYTYGMALAESFSNLAAIREEAGDNPAPIILGVDLGQHLDNLRPLFLTATELGQPIKDGLKNTYRAAVSLLLKQSGSAQ